MSVVEHHRKTHNKLYRKLSRTGRRLLLSALAGSALVACAVDKPTMDDPEIAGPEIDGPEIDGPEIDGTIEVSGGIVFGGPSVARGAAFEVGAEYRIECAAECSGQIGVWFDGRGACLLNETVQSRGDGLARVGLTAPVDDGRYLVRWASTVGGSSCDAAVAAARDGGVLTEVVVEAVGPGPLVNQAPVIEGFDFGRATFANDCVASFGVFATDSDGDDLAYTWFINGEDIDLRERGGRFRRFGALELRVVVEDGRGGVAEASTSVYIPACTINPDAVPSVDGQSAYFVVDLGDFDVTRAALARDQMRLAQVEDAAEQAFLFGQFGDAGRLYIGARRVGRSFGFLDGTPVREAAWCPGEPNTPEETAVEFGFGEGGCWNDLFADSPLRGLAEIELRGGDDDVSRGGRFERGALRRGAVDSSVLYIDGPQTVNIRISDGAGGCPRGSDPELTVSLGGTRVGRNDDANGTRCPSIDLELARGVYDITSAGGDGAAIPAYTLHMVPGRVVQPEGEFCADEALRCAFDGTRTVYYGAGDSWVTRVATGGFDCSNEAFETDPVPEVSKRCFVAP